MSVPVNKFCNHDDVQLIKQHYDNGQVLSIPYIAIKGSAPQKQLFYYAVCFKVASEVIRVIEWPKRFLAKDWMSVRNEIFDVIGKEIEINTTTCTQIDNIELNINTSRNVIPFPG